MRWRKERSNEVPRVQEGQMPQSVTGTGILAGVDGSAESDAAIRWATHEAVMRRAPLTLAHVVAPAVASWPMGPMDANIAEWQEDKAGHDLGDAVQTGA